MAFVNRLMVAVWIVCIFCPAVGRSDQPASEFTIRDPAGKTLIASDQIRHYDWATHTLTLTPGTPAKLLEELRNGPGLAAGVPFSVFVGDMPVYRGHFTSNFSSQSFDTPTIVVDRSAQDSNLTDEELRIELGYPTRQFFKENDPRSGGEIRTALQQSGKLDRSIELHTAWIAASLLEMQSLKPGMTRSQLLEVFREEGGISSRQQRRYAYRDCPFIKVDVKFNPVVETPMDKLNEDPRDTIAEISQPFLEWSIGD